MSMNRRTFLTRASALTALGLCLPSSLFSQNAATTAPVQSAKKAGPVTKFVPLRRDVGYFTGRGGTIGWLGSEAALVAVDTQFPETAVLFLEGMPKRGGRNLDVVFNTHHHGDHVSGNGVFKRASKTIIAQRNAPRFQMREAEANNALAQNVFADTKFDSVWHETLGDETVSARFFGPAHTGGDSVIYFEKANVVHVGDLVFNRLYPFIDLPGGGSIRNWIKVLEAVAKEYPADALFIYGHGNPKFGVSGQRGDLLVMRDYFSALLAHVEKEIVAGKTRKDIVALQNLPGFEDFYPSATQKSRFPGNLESAFDELTAKQGT